jgi:DNA polymerase III epsilon subunit-like protein
MYLFIDTETSGLPRSYDAPPSTSSNWPRLVTLAWLYADADGRELRSEHSLVKPDGWSISAETTAIHGITTERARAEGIPVARVLKRFAVPVWQCGAIIAHNFNFDHGVVGSEFLRAGLVDSIAPKLNLCTMLSSVDVVRLPPSAKMLKAGFTKFKSPRLAELHRFLFGDDPPNQHDAMGDTRTCAKCFFELRRRDLLPSIGDSATAAKGGAA